MFSFFMSFKRFGFQQIFPQKREVLSFMFKKQHGLIAVLSFFMHAGEPCDTHPSADASPHGYKSEWKKCLHAPTSPESNGDPHRSPANGLQKSGAVYEA
jgi:hypothetical protein